MFSDAPRQRRTLHLLVLCAPVTLGTDAVPGYRTARWLVRGIGAELAVNLGGRGGPSWRRTLRSDGPRAPALGEGALAIVTGATSGIGSEVAAGIASIGYHVVIGARDRRKGKKLEAELRAAGWEATFIELHMELPTSVAAFKSALPRGRHCALLVNNAGVMGVSDAETLSVNLVGPAILTTSLLPMLHAAHQRADGRQSPRVVNVGSSSHLRASHVDPRLATSTSRDANLAAYAASKLGLMQLSMLIRSASPWLEVVDAHPGIVWTPMLQRHLGAIAPVVHKVGLSRLLFKTPAAGAATILAAAVSPRSPPRHWGERSRWARGWRCGQPYFVNRRPSGFASAESRDLAAAACVWRELIEPIAKRVLPEAEVGAVSCCCRDSTPQLHGGGIAPARHSVGD